MSPEDVVDKAQHALDQLKKSLEEIDLNAKDDTGRTALHICALRGFDELAEVLLMCGADESIENENGETPLMEAIEEGVLGPVRTLAWHGDVNYENRRGENAYGWAEYFGDESIVGYVKLSGGYDNGVETEKESSENEWRALARPDIKLSALLPRGYRHTLFEKLKVLRPKDNCGKYYCTTCGGIVPHIQRTMTYELRVAIEEFIAGHSEEEMVKLGTSREQMNRLLRLSEGNI